jgi:putative transposase
MPGTYSQMLLHIVFSTKHREPWIKPEIAERLYPYVGGIVRAEKGMLYDIGGIEDHVHLYLRWRPDESVSNLMRTVKARSSKWVHDTFPALGTFAWQEGYSVFSVSKSQGRGREEVHRGTGRASQEGGLQVRTSANAPRAQRRVRRAVCVRLIRPVGADILTSHLYHGLRTVRFTASGAPPVATTRGPVGAEELGIATPQPTPPRLAACRPGRRWLFSAARRTTCT